MKNALIVLPLLFATPSCATLQKLLEVPAAAASDVGGAVDTITPGDQEMASTAGTVASTGTTVLTGNPALGAIAGSLVTGLAAWFLTKRKKAAA